MADTFTDDFNTGSLTAWNPHPPAGYFQGGAHLTIIQEWGQDGSACVACGATEQSYKTIPGTPANPWSLRFYLAVLADDPALVGHQLFTAAHMALAPASGSDKYAQVVVYAGDAELASGASELTLRVKTDTFTNEWVHTGDGSLPFDGSWHSVQITYAGGASTTVNVYIDNVLVATDSITTTAITHHTLDNISLTHINFDGAVIAAVDNVATADSDAFVSMPAANGATLTEDFCSTSPEPEEIRGSFFGGVNTTVTATRAWGIGLDGNTNVHNEVGKFKIFGDFEYTGTGTLPGFAPSTPSFVTLGTNATLTAERVLTGSGRITVTDAGTGSTVTLDIPNDAINYGRIQNVSAASRLLGRGSAAGAGDVEEITLGTGLSMSGTVLSSSGVDREWSVLTNGDPTNPELIFAGGDVVMLHTP